MLQKFRDLTRGVAIYGAGDVAIQVVNFLLLRVYVLYLTKIDYGVLALLAGVEGPIKLFFRWGIDGAFMRYWYDCEDDSQRQRLASTLFFFLLGVNGLFAIHLVDDVARRLARAEPGDFLRVRRLLVNLFQFCFDEVHRNGEFDLREIIFTR